MIPFVKINFKRFLHVMPHFLYFACRLNLDTRLYNPTGIITGASRRLEPVIKCCLFLSFFQSRFQGPAFRCDKIVVIVTLHGAIEGIPDKDYNFWGSENFHNLYERILHERKLKSGYLERRIYERPLHLRDLRAFYRE